MGLVGCSLYAKRLFDAIKYIPDFPDLQSPRLTQSAEAIATRVPQRIAANKIFQNILEEKVMPTLPVYQFK